MEGINFSTGESWWKRKEFLRVCWRQSAYFIFNPWVCSVIFWSGVSKNIFLNRYSIYSQDASVPPLFITAANDKICRTFISGIFNFIHFHIFSGIELFPILQGYFRIKLFSSKFWYLPNKEIFIFVWFLWRVIFFAMSTEVDTAII